MKRLKLLLLWLAFSQMGIAQTGHYFVSHYKPDNDNINYISYDIVQNPKGVLYFASRRGVLEFDGRDWQLVETKGAVYTLSVSSKGDVFAGGSRGFGKLGWNDQNVQQYFLLSDSLGGARNIFASVPLEDKIYFLNEWAVYEMDLNETKPRVTLASSSETGHFSGIFLIDNQLYLATEKKGLVHLSSSLEPAGFPELGDAEIIFSESSPDAKSYLIATDDGRLFLRRNGTTTVEFKPNDMLYLNNNVMANASWVTNTLVAIGTLRGGVVFVDVDTGETKDILHYFTGLPDNDVYAIHTDRHQGVWVAHDYGFTRIAPFLPFRTYNHYPGLVGNLLCVQSIGDQVYVGTTVGLFQLVREEIYEDETYTVTQSTTVTTPEETQEIQDEIRQTSKKNKFGFLSLKKKKKEEPTPATPKKQVVTIKPASTKTVTRQIQRKRKILKGVQYVFKPVEGISGKVDQLMVAENKLLCGGVGGVYEINGLQSSSVSRDPARTIYYANNLKQLLIGTYDDEITSFRNEQKGWQAADFPDSLSVYADYLFEDNLENLWICGRDLMYKVGIEDGQLLDIEKLPLPEAAVDRTVGLSYGSDVYVAQNGQFFQYASYKNAFVKYDSLPSPRKYFASGGSFWFYDGHRWRTIDKRLQGSIKTEWLGLFSDLRFLSPAEQGKSLWVITSTNELYKFAGDMANSPSVTNPLFLKEVRGTQSKLSVKKIMQVDETESALTFEFIQPEFVSLQAVEYRYFVKGLQKTWTDWSNLNNVIQFPFLPPGKYAVMVESKDLFGNVSKMESIDFKVVPPYWKRSWFYALEFFVFGTMVVLSLRLNVSQLKYRYLSRFLSALTIILLIQFIQTIIAVNLNFKSTPVAEFLVQVMIALMVLPVEEFMRKKMVQADKKIH
ncbi:MAG: hypothetical protein JST14_13855 [Bacteroidetes bacterium]|nr:hypothetical protein [Bacteroidota bacterium]